MTLRTALCKSCGQPVDRSNAPNRFCARSHTHKEDLKAACSIIKIIEGLGRPSDATPDDYFGWTMNEASEAQGKPQGGPWWTAVDLSVDLQNKSQLLNETKEPPTTSRQLPLFPATTAPDKS